MRGYPCPLCPSHQPLQFAPTYVGSCVVLLPTASPRCVGASRDAGALISFSCSGCPMPPAGRKPAGVCCPGTRRWLDSRTKLRRCRGGGQEKAAEEEVDALFEEDDDDGDYDPSAVDPLAEGDDGAALTGEQQAQADVRARPLRPPALPALVVARRPPLCAPCRRLPEAL